jgi:hypothetical protein
MMLLLLLLLLPLAPQLETPSLSPLVYSHSPAIVTVLQLVRKLHCSIVYYYSLKLILPLIFFFWISNFGFNGV